jgi:hypothetical protein
MGGRRRKRHTMRKPVRFAHRGGRTMKGGAVLPGMSGTIGTAGAEWSGTSLSGPYSSATGQPIADPYSSQAGGRRRRGKTRGRKSRGRKSRRAMRGGAAQIPQRAGVLEFTGAGAARGMGGFEATTRAIPNDVVPLRG